MALSTVACAVIIRICGRSPSGVECDELANQLEPGQLRHHVVDDQHIERCARRAAAAPRAGSPFDDARGRRRAAPRPSALRIFSSSSTSRIEPRMSVMVRRRRSRPGRIARELDANRRCPRPARCSTVIVPPSPSMMFLRDRQPEAGAAALGREVRVEDVRADRPARCRRRWSAIAIDHAARAEPGGCVAQATTAPSGVPFTA